MSPITRPAPCRTTDSRPAPPQIAHAERPGLNGHDNDRHRADINAERRFAIAALGHPALGRVLHDAATSAFPAAAPSALVAGSVAASGVVLAALFLSSQPASPTAYQAETDAGAVKELPEITG